MLCVLYFCTYNQFWIALEGVARMSMTVVMLMGLFMVFCVFTFVRGD